MQNSKKYLTMMVLMAMYSHSQAGRFEMIQSAIKKPSLETCSPFRDMLGDEFQYSQNDISGPIPYTRSYKTGLSENYNRYNEITEGQKTIGGWQDNFNHYLALEDQGNTKSTDFRVMVRLRFFNQNDEDFYVAGLGSDKKINKISRIFSPSPMVYETRLANSVNNSGWSLDEQVGYHSPNHGDKGLVLNSSSNVFSNEKNVNNIKNLSFTLYHEGTKYTLSFLYVKGNETVYKITVAELPTGQILNFKYDSTGGLVKVVDQYGNFLVIERNQKDGDADSAYSYPTKVTAGKFSTKSISIGEYLNRVPTSAELASDKVQTASYSYQEFIWKNFRNDNFERIYALSKAQSTNNGDEFYTYAKTGNVNAVNNFNDSGSTNPEYQIPSLESVYKEYFKDESVGYQKSILAKFDYKKYDDRLWYHLPFSSSQNGIKRISGIKTGDDEEEYKGFTIKRQINFISIDGVTNKEVDPTYIEIKGDHRSRDLNIGFSGNPCITYNKVPIKQVGFDSATSYLRYLIDKKGNKTTFGYDDFGRVTSVVEAEQDAILKRTTTYTYSSDQRRFQTPTKIEKKDEVITNVLDGKGRPIETIITNTNGAVTKNKKYTNVYVNDLLKTQTDADGTVKTIEYEDVGVNKKKETVTKDGLSAFTEYSNYNSAGEVGRIVEPTGIVKTILFNSNNLPKTVEERDPITNISHKTSYKYNFRNQVVQENHPDAKSKKFEFDDNNGQLLSIIEPDQYLKTKYTYNSNGQILTEKEQYYVANSSGIPMVEGVLKEIVTNIYDRSARIFEEKYGANTAANWKRTEYDANGNVNKITKPSVDAINSVESFTYDSLNRVKDYTDPLSKIYTYQYDSFDNGTLKKASNGSNSTNTFVSGKDLAKETNSDFGIKEYTYDDASNLLTSKHAATRYCNFLSYDVLDQFKQSNCQNINQSVSTKDVIYKFNYHLSRFGRLDNVESLNKTGFTDTRYWGGNTAYGYDGLDRVTSKEQRIGRLQTSDKKLVVNYKYTDGDRIKEITYPSGKKISYVYDYFTMPDPFTGGETIYGDPRLATIMNGDQKLLGLGYNDLSLVSSIRWGNGNTTDYLYDSVKNITNITNKVANVDYDSIVDTYYNNGLLQTKKIGAQTRTYKYDKKGQLLQEIVGGGYTHTFTYDDNGNRKSFSSTGTGNPYPITSAAYTYTTSGNKFATMTHNSVAQSFSYNATGELNLPNLLGTAVYDYQGRRASEGATPDGKFTAHEIEYNHKNQRILTARNGVNRQYVYDEADHLLGEYDANGVAIVEYVWLGDKPVAALYPNRTVYLLTDEKNTPYRGIDAANNAKVWVRTADAFGVAKPAVETVEMNLRFPGQIYDKATGLHYNLNRYYNPLLGRYMEADPIGLEGGWNPYAYAENDPINNTDESGLVIDIVADVGFIAYDLYKIARTGATVTNLAALGADVAGAVIPGATGLGNAVRAAEKIKSTKVLRGGEDFVKSKAESIKNAKGLCEYCQSNPATQGDHAKTLNTFKQEVNSGKLTRPEAKKKANSAENIVASCSHCNQKEKHMKDLGTGPNQYNPPNPNARVQKMLEKK